MSRGDRRTLLPPQLRDLATWPCPDTSVFNLPMQADFAKRRTAVEMYAIGVPYPEIRKATGKSKSEVRRLVLRCIEAADDGFIHGFRALISHVPIKPYERVRPVLHEPGSGSGGCSGAMRQLLRRFPEIETLIQDEFFKRSNDGLNEARIAISALHEKFKNALRKQGLNNEDWPFNTANCGYLTLWRYCKDLRLEYSQGAATARSGTEAARRGSVGTGTRSLFPPLRPFGAVQLDFHKVDAASVIVLENDNGKSFEFPLSRWHFGLVVEERYGAALGFCVALELTPSGDSTLEAISSALGINDATVAEAITVTQNKFLLHHLVPELAHQTFSVLKVDNGWSNAAHEVVNNIIDTVGCAINFGPTHAWWRRNLIERIFGELTRRGLQRLPSTYGSGPGDTRKDNPQGKAVKFKIDLPTLVKLFQQCLREHNVEASEGLQWSSPLQCIQAALERPASGLFKQPLPAIVQRNPRLMMHQEEVTVRGSVAKNVRPYFNLDRHRHTNVKLANSPWLIGKTIVVCVDRRLARITFATVKETGEPLGQMMAAGPWARSSCSWRDRKLLGRAGLSERYHSDSEDPLEATRREKIAQLAALPKARMKKTSRTALEVAKMDAQKSRAAALPKVESTAPMPISSAGQTPNVRSFDRFGLFSIPRTKGN